MAVEPVGDFPGVFEDLMSFVKKSNLKESPRNSQRLLDGQSIAQMAAREEHGGLLVAVHRFRQQRSGGSIEKPSNDAIDRRHARRGQRASGPDFASMGLRPDLRDALGLVASGGEEPNLAR